MSTHQVCFRKLTHQFRQSGQVRQSDREKPPQKNERTHVLSSCGGSPCWTRTNDLAVNSRSLLPTELRRNIQFSFFCGSRSPLATSGSLVATRFSLYAKISASLALGFGLFRHTVSKLNAVAPTELRRNIRFSPFKGVTFRRKKRRKEWNPATPYPPKSSPTKYFRRGKA